MKKETAMRELSYPNDLGRAVSRSQTLVLIAPQKLWKKGFAKRLGLDGLPARTKPLLDGLEPGLNGASAATIDASSPRRLVVGILPDTMGRSNSPCRQSAIEKVMSGVDLGSGEATVVLGLDRAEHLSGALAGVWRHQPLFSRKSGKAPKKTKLNLLAVDARGELLRVDKRSKEIAAAGRWAASMVDTPPQEMTTAQLAAEARKLVRGLPNVTTRVVTGAALEREKLGGLHAVGRTAVVPPRLLVMEYRPPKAELTIGLVGKGIIYDTGGLSLKIGGNMCTMKGDMGGAAAVAGAFRVLASTRCKHRVVALLCLAENAIGPTAYRPDDIITMHSGHTIEINNTDAEGRLVLGDGVSYAARKLKADVVIDAATLTGAQLISTGIQHAAVVTNRDALEELALRSGKESGDLCSPLPFAPEFHKPEFASVVADMKNSVKNRMNAQSSCAGYFVYSQIDDLDLPWLHVDLAGPSMRRERGTGYGVALLSTIAEQISTKTAR